MFIVEANANKAWCTERELLTTGSKGLQVKLSFSDDWDGMTKFAIFRAYDVSWADLVQNDTVTIPDSVLVRPNVNLLMGLYGVNAAGTVAIPTVYTDLGAIRKGAEIYDADNAQVPTDAAEFYEQLAALVSAAEEAANEARTGLHTSTAAMEIDDDGHLIMTITGETESTADLGPVTAYAAAVAGGYTGTYEQFQALLTANAQTEYEVAAALAAVEEVVDTADAASAAATAASAAATSAETAATAAQTAVASKQAQHKTATVTLQAGQTTWSNVSVTGVTANNTVIVTPAPASFSAWVTAGVYCSAQGSGTLTFKASAAPSSALTANIVILD